MKEKLNKLPIVVRVMKEKYAPSKKVHCSQAEKMTAPNRM
jgi:hypothetical protein